ncbi:hypothetical protein KVG29_08975 [Caldicoprobacter algeriensis]|uniref:hypothetical protein n=1 Tax=Caldicoprobacter algeriensis TaxID=699281 RepID=UPI00207A2790|nr:hypothetical protein [Caldicoprobacter algeriensis]MCM8901352.1 hypothetical protein [Caldicoprobacter algeriensis]
MVKRLYPEPSKKLEEVWDRLLFTRNVKDFDPSGGKKPEELYSLNYEDYNYVKALLLELITRA